SSFSSGSTRVSKTFSSTSNEKYALVFCGSSWSGSPAIAAIIFPNASSPRATCLPAEHALRLSDTTAEITARAARGLIKVPPGFVWMSSPYRQRALSLGTTSGPHVMRDGEQSAPLVSAPDRVHAGVFRVNGRMPRTTCTAVTVQQTVDGTPG